MAKVTATFETGWMFSCASIFKNINGAHLWGAEMSTTEKRSSSSKIMLREIPSILGKNCCMGFGSLCLKKVCLLLGAFGWAFFTMVPN